MIVSSSFEKQKELALTTNVIKKLFEGVLNAVIYFLYATK